MSHLFHLRRTSLESIKIVWKTSKLFRLSFLISFILWLLLLVMPFFRLTPSADEGNFIPLHYNVFFGVDKFGPWYSVFQLPAFGLFFLLINNWLAARFFEREKILSAFFMVTTVLIQVVLLAAMSFTILLNM